MNHGGSRGNAEHASHLVGIPQARMKFAVSGKSVAWQLVSRLGLILIIVQLIPEAIITNEEIPRTILQLGKYRQARAGVDAGRRRIAD